MKKSILGIIFMVSISVGLMNAQSDRNSNLIISEGNNYNSLKSATTEVFTIYLTSSNTGTTTGRYTSYASSITLEQLNSGGGSATNYFNVLLSTSDTIYDLINRINDITNFTATISPGCYGLQYATGSASSRIDSEGTTDGLQYDATGKSVSFSTGSANAITVYFNGTLYASHKFNPIKYTECSVRSMNNDLARGTTFYIYEGSYSSTTVTLLDIPRTDLKVFEYPSSSPLQIPDQKYWEFVVKYGTWTVNTGENLNRTSINYYRYKR